MRATGGGGEEAGLTTREVLEGEGEPRAGAHYSRAPGAREEGLQITGDAALTTRRAKPS